MRLDEEAAKKIGLRVGADYVVFGSLTKIGNYISLDARMISITEDKPPLTAFTQHQALDDVMLKIGDFGTEIGIETGHLITALLLAQVVGIPCSFLFGRVAGWMGTKPAIFLTLGCYTGISVLGYFMSTAAHFYALALLVGTVQGGSQALSRSLFATMVPRSKSSEFFGFFGVSEKFAGILGPLVFAGVVALSGSSRGAVLSVIIFFIAGAILLSRVDVDEGQRVARDASAEAR
jgi:UMF1 family MFS transporter